MRFLNYESNLYLIKYLWFIIFSYTNKFLKYLMRKIISKNPYTGQIRKEYNFISKEELENKIAKG